MQGKEYELVNQLAVLLRKNGRKQKIETCPQVFELKSEDTFVI
jgi:hypothetical protein